MNQTIDQQFFAPRPLINIAVLPDAALEAQAIRAVLEGLGYAVIAHWIGTPGDFLKVLGQGDDAPRYLLITGHGDEDDGFYLGEYADFIDTSMLRHHHLPAEAIAPIVNLPGCTVITTACAAGVEAMGRAFTGRGTVRAYIACRDYPDGGDMLVFVVNFFHALMRKHMSDREAWRHALHVTDAPEVYAISYFHKDGTEDRFQPDASRNER
ncbi:MAG: hypothetical protein ACUVS2_08975 [Candidatus Flexifilum sp.]|jgi:hypothetical protein